MHECALLAIEGAMDKYIISTGPAQPLVIYVVLYTLDTINYISDIKYTIVEHTACGIRRTVRSKATGTLIDICTDV